jgi:hypothetical protein
VKITSSIAKTAVLKTIAVTNVAVVAVFAALELTPDLETSQLLRKQKGKTRTWRTAGKKEGVVLTGEWVYIKGNLF